jgi:predicted transcriptional regulator|tara:strand:- start:221 stop:796 length:576 start_codon:yes stop_codon:yes gene_type:complete
MFAVPAHRLVLHSFAVHPGEPTLPDMTSPEDLVSLTTDIVAAYVVHNSVSVGDVSALISVVHTALVSLGRPLVPAAEATKPAVALRASIKPEYLICLEDGRHVKMLKRYLATRYNLTPAEYRAKWKLPADYPMVAPNYAERRRELAHSIGLGRKRSPMAEPAPAAPEPEPTPESAPSPKTPRRKLKIAAKG